MSGNILLNPLSAEPGLVGGPGQPGAAFLYPTLQPDSSAGRQYISYNSKDNVNVSWVSWAANDTETTLQLWYWTPNFATNIWYPLGSERVPVNGSKIIHLDTVPNWQSNYYIGQWNLNFTRADNSPTTGLTVSGFFNCSFADVPSGRLWGAEGGSNKQQAFQVGPAVPTTTVVAGQYNNVPLGSSSSTPNGYVSSSALASANPSSQNLSGGEGGSAGDQSSGNITISGGAIAGVIIGVFVAFGLGAIAMHFILIRKKRKQSTDATVSIAEKDSQNRSSRPYAFFRRFTMALTSTSATGSSPYRIPSESNGSHSPSASTTAKEIEGDPWSGLAGSELPASGLEAGIAELPSSSEPREML